MPFGAVAEWRVYPSDPDGTGAPRGEWVADAVR